MLLASEHMAARQGSMMVIDCGAAMTVRAGGDASMAKMSSNPPSNEGDRAKAVMWEPYLASKGGNLTDMVEKETQCDGSLNPEQLSSDSNWIQNCSAQPTQSSTMVMRTHDYLG